MTFERGHFVYWRSNSGIGVGVIRAVDAARHLLCVRVDGLGFPIWLPMKIVGLHVFPELDLTIPLPRRSDYA